MRRLAELLFPNDEIGQVKYFTARVSDEPDNPGQHRRQQSYLRALRATDVEIVYGTFQTQARWMRREAPCANADFLDVVGQTGAHARSVAYIPRHVNSCLDGRKA